MGTEKLFIICCRCFSNSNDDKLILSFFASLFVAISVILINIWRENYSKKKEIRKRLRDEVYMLCEKLIRYAIYSSQRNLQARFYYSMHKVDRDEEFDKTLYIKYLDHTESSSLSFYLIQAELISKMGELQDYWKNPNEIKKIKELLLKKDYSPINQFDGIFTNKMTKEQIEKILKQEMNNIQNYVLNESYCKNLLEIQKIMNPNI